MVSIGKNSNKLSYGLKHYILDEYTKCKYESKMENSGVNLKVVGYPYLDNYKQIDNKKDYAKDIDRGNDQREKYVTRHHSAVFCIYLHRQGGQFLCRHARKFRQFRIEKHGEHANKIVDRVQNRHCKIASRFAIKIAENESRGGGWEDLIHVLVIKAEKYGT